MTEAREPFGPFTSAVVPLPVDDIDTDQIIPARFLKTTERSGLAEALFRDWRFESDGSQRLPAFVVDRPEMAGRQILLAGANFGCGSSREHAPWALTAFGFRAVLATGFADIFRNNAMKNGLLPIVLEPEQHEALLRIVAMDPQAEIGVDLEAQEVALPDGSLVTFPIDAFAKRMLLEGTDEIGWVLARADAIDAYEGSRRPRVDTRPHA